MTENGKDGLQADLERLMTKSGLTDATAHESVALVHLALQAADIDVDQFPTKEYKWLLEWFIRTVSTHQPSKANKVIRDYIGLFPELLDPKLLAKLKKELGIEKMTDKQLDNLGVRKLVAGSRLGIRARQLDNRLKAGHFLDACVKDYQRFAVSESQGRDIWKRLAQKKLDPAGLDDTVDIPEKLRQPAAGFGQILAKSAELRKSLRAQKIQDEVRREIVDSEIVPKLLEAESASILVVRGDAGSGKTVIAGQVYDALQQHKVTSAVVVPCQWLNDSPHTTDELDASLGKLLLIPDGLTAAVAKMSENRPGQTVVILDTIDKILSQSTSGSIVELFHRLLRAGASIVMTCRNYEYDMWLQPQVDKFGSKFHKPVDVPALSKDEVARLVQGYVLEHPPRTPMDPTAFSGDIWSNAQALKAQDRDTMHRIVTNPYFLLMLCETFSDAGEVAPDLTTAGLCDLYVDHKINYSRRHGKDPLIAKAKRRLLGRIARKLLKDSRESIVISIPQLWLDKKAEDHEALEDLRSEEVLVQAPLDTLEVAVNHQFLAEYLIARYLRDEAPKKLDALLVERKAAPERRWFTWQFIRHVLAVPKDEGQVRHILEFLDLNEVYAYQTAAQGLAEQRHRGFFPQLSEYPSHYPTLLSLRVLFFVPDSRLDEAFTVLKAIMLKGTADDLGRASTAIGRLAARTINETEFAVPDFPTLLDTVTEIREGRAKANGKGSDFLEQLLQNMLQPLIDRNIVLPELELLHTHKFVSRQTQPTGVSSVVRIHLVEGVQRKIQRQLCEKLLGYKFANKIKADGGQLLSIAADWRTVQRNDISLVNAPKLDQSDAVDGKGRVEWDDVDPVEFLQAGGRNSEQLRAATLAVVANSNKEFRPRLVELFTNPPDGETANRAIISLQEVAKTPGQAWLLAELRARIDERNPVVHRLNAVVAVLETEAASIRHAWADWYGPLVTEEWYGSVDAYLRVGWDHPQHLAHGIEKFTLISPELRKKIVANLASIPMPGKFAAVSSLSESAHHEVDPLLLVRCMDEAHEADIRRLISMVESDYQNAAAQAILKLQRAAKRQPPTIWPEQLNRFAEVNNPQRRTGILEAVQILVDKRVGDVDRTVAQWLEKAVERVDEVWSGLSQEQIHLLKVSHSYLRDNYGRSPEALTAIAAYVDQIVSQAGQYPDPQRELLMLIKTTAYRSDQAVRRRGAAWILDLLDTVDVKAIKSGESETRITLQKFIRQQDLSLELIIARSTTWKEGSHELLVDLIVMNSKDGASSTLLDELSESRESTVVKSRIAWHRTGRRT